MTTEDGAAGDGVTVRAVLLPACLSASRTNSLPSRVSAAMPNQHGAVSQLIGINTLGKVGA
jgi:hypothetical protein